MEINKQENKKNVVLFLPNTRWFGKRPWMMISHAALLLTAMLKEKFDFSIIDATAHNLSEEECLGRLENISPDVVLISALSVEYHAQYHRAVYLSKKACPEVLTVMGGVYPTVMSDEAMSDTQLDYIFIGPAEERIVPFLDLLFENNIEKIRKFPGIGFRENDDIRIDRKRIVRTDISTIVQCDYSLVDMEPYMIRAGHDYQFNSLKRSAPIISSYGCPHNCIFCATRTISGRSILFRPVRDVLEEIEFLIENYQVDDIVFLDDNFLHKRKRTIELLQSIIDNQYNISWKIATVAAWHLDDELLEMMKKSGCTQITISVESGSSRVLHKIIRKPLKLEIVPPIVKKCKELEIDIAANFVIGLPGETWEELRQSFSFAEKCDFNLVHFHIATPLPETDLYNLSKELGFLPPNFNFIDYKQMGYCQGVISTPEFTPGELMVLRAYEWDRINFSTPSKTEKVAKMYCMTIDELSDHRKKTRLNCGVYF